MCSSSLVFGDNLCKQSDGKDLPVEMLASLQYAVYILVQRTNRRSGLGMAENFMKPGR